MAAGVMNRSGITRSAPDIIAAYGSPQALAWNCGTIGMTRSYWPTPSAFAVHAAIECR